MLRNFTPATDEEKRQLYVAITRAKTNLSIHCNGDYLKPFSAEGLAYAEDVETYPEPQQITLFLTHRDVQLGYFEYVQHRIHNLFSGASLQVLENGLGNEEGEFVCKYSQKFMDFLAERQEKGFRIADAKVNFVVYWKNEAKDKESKIILPQLLLKKE